MRDDGETPYKQSAVISYAGKPVAAQVGDEAVLEFFPPLDSRLAEVVAVAHDLPENRPTELFETQSFTDKATPAKTFSPQLSSSTPIRRRCWGSAAVPPGGGGCAVAPCVDLADKTRTSKPSSRRGTLAGTRAARRKTDNSSRDLVERASVFSIDTSKAPMDKLVKARAAHAHSYQVTRVARREADGSRGTCQSSRCYRAGSPPMPHCEAMNDPTPRLRAATADPTQIGGVPAGQQHASRKEGSFIKTCDVNAREPTERSFSLKTMSSAKGVTGSTVGLSRLTRRTGSLPVVLHVQKSFSTAALLPSKPKAANGAVWGVAEPMTDPTTYSRLPPEVWVYKGLEGCPVSAVSASREEYFEKRSTFDGSRGVVAGGCRARTSAAAGSPARQWRSLSLGEKRLAFPLEQPDGHQQADFLCSCIPTLLEVNNVPTLFSLKHSTTAVEPTTSAFSRQASTPANSPDATAARTPCASADRPAVSTPNLLFSSKERGSRRVTVSEEPPAAGRAGNARADPSLTPSNSTRDVPPNDRLSKGLQAAHDARVSSEWWAGLINVIDVTLSELCRQLRTFAPFHAKCLDVIHQLLVDYADMYQQIHARQLAQLHTPLLEAHAEHAALRKEIVRLGHKVGMLESKAREAGELRRVLDIHAHLFSLQEMEVLTAQQMEEEAIRADFQWHQLSEVVQAIKFGKDRSLSTDVWTSNCSDERENKEGTQQSHQLLSAVLPTVITLIPHETIVRGTLNASVHVRLLRIHIPPGRWNLGIAITCSQPLDITLLLLLGAKHIRSTETKEDRNRSEQTAISPGKEEAQRNFRSGLRTFDLVERGPVPTSAFRVPPSVASSCPSQTTSEACQGKASYTHLADFEVPDFYSGALQIAAFSSFRIDPEQPQILQVATPAADSHSGGWVLVRLQGAFCTKRNLAQKALEACRNSLVASASSETTRDTRAELQNPPQPLSSPFLTYVADGDGKDKKLQMVGTGYKLAHAHQDGDAETCQNKMGRSRERVTCYNAGSNENIEKKTDMSFDLGRDDLAAALCMKEELRFFLTVHSVFLHKSVRSREEHGSSGDSEQPVHAQTNACQLQPSGLAAEESTAGPMGSGPGFLVKSARVPYSAGPDVTRTICGRPRRQYRWPPRVISKQDANTQTISSKLLRGFVRRFHEGPRPPPIPQFCVCKSDVLEFSPPPVEQNPRYINTQTDEVANASPSSQADLELTSTSKGETQREQRAIRQVSSRSAEPAGTLRGDTPVNMTSVGEREQSSHAPKRALDKSNDAYYYPPSYPILKLLLDETPIALGDFTTLLCQNHVLRDATEVPTAFRGVHFMRWPPRLLAETVWVILLEHTRAQKRRGAVLQQQHLHSGCLHTNGESCASRKPLAGRNPVDSAVLPANAPGVGAPLQGTAASKPDSPHASESYGGSKYAARKCDSLQSSPANPRQGGHGSENPCGMSARSLAAFTFKYFLTRLDVAFLAHSVLHSFLLSILYWAPVLEAVSVQPQLSGGVATLHRPLHFSGTIGAEITTRTTKDSNIRSINDDSQGGKYSAETVREKEVKLATSKSRGFVPWYAVRLFARITDLLSSPRDTQLLRGSLDDFVRLVLQAFLEELTVNSSSRKRRGRTSFKAGVTGELNRGSVSCDAAPSRLPSDRSVVRHRSSVGSHSFCGKDRLSLLFIPRSQLEVPTELCLAVTYRAAARIGVRIFSEEGTSEYRTAVLQAISDSKEAALASIRLSKGIYRWMQTAATTSSSVGQKETASQRTSVGRTSIIHHALDRENVSRKGRRRSRPPWGGGEGELSTCGPPKIGDPISCRVGLDSSNDAAWELPMSADLLLQILTQQWEVLYVHLQQAMELVLDETDVKLLEPLSSLSGFSSLIRRLNSSGTSTPEDVLQLYYKTLSSTSSRLQPFCSPLSSNALSALLLYRSRLTDFPLPFSPSPFVTLAPLVEVAETSAVPRSTDVCSLVRTDTEALPLWCIHTRSPLSFTTTMSNATQLSVISSASHEFRLAEFIVEGLITFVRSGAGAGVKADVKQGTHCAGNTVSASIAGNASVWQRQLFMRKTDASLTHQKGVEQRLSAEGQAHQSASAAVRVKGSVPVTSSKDSVVKSASLVSLYTPSGSVSRCMRGESATDVHAVGIVRYDGQTRHPVCDVEDFQRQVAADSNLSTCRDWVSDVFESGCCGQQRVGGQDVQVEVEGWTPVGKSTSTRGGVTGRRSSQGSHIENIDPILPTTRTDGVSASRNLGQNHSSSVARTDTLPFYRSQDAGTCARIIASTQASGATQRLCARSSFSHLDIVLNRSIALETAREIETAAVTEGVPVRLLLARLQSFLKGLLHVFGRTDLPDTSVDEESAEPQENSGALQNDVNLVRSLEGFTPSRGRLSSPVHNDGKDVQVLSSTDVATAQILLQCIWNAIFKISALMAEEREQKRTLGNLVALQRVQCRAGAKEALSELARIYRDQVDRLLILSIGSEGISAIMEQPELREQLLQLHQSVFDLEHQQLRLQQLFTSVAGTAAAGKLQQSDEQPRGEQDTEDPAIAGAAAADKV